MGDGNLRIKRPPAPLAQRAPSQIRHPELKSCRANNPDLGQPQNLTTSFQNQVAEVFFSPADSAIRPRLIEVRIVEQIEHL